MNKTVLDNEIKTLRLLLDKFETEEVMRLYVIGAIDALEWTRGGKSSISIPTKLAGIMGSVTRVDFRELLDGLPQKFSVKQGKD